MVIECVCIDNAMEFGYDNAGNQYFQDQGILHQMSIAYTPQQSILVERKHRRVMNVARALYFQSAVGYSFLGECIKNYNLFDQSYTISCPA